MKTTLICIVNTWKNQHESLLGFGLYKKKVTISLTVFTEESVGSTEGADWKAVPTGT